MLLWAALIGTLANWERVLYIDSFILSINWPCGVCAVIQNEIPFPWGKSTPWEEAVDSLLSCHWFTVVCNPGELWIIPLNFSANKTGSVWCNLFFLDLFVLNSHAFLGHYSLLRTAPPLCLFSDNFYYKLLLSNTCLFSRLSIPGNPWVTRCQISGIHQSQAGCTFFLSLLSHGSLNSVKILSFLGVELRDNLFFFFPLFILF